MAAGFRGLAAPWVGGAAAPPRTAGYRSLLAFWLGGAAAGVGAVEPEEEPGAGGLAVPIQRPRQYESAPSTAPKRLRKRVESGAAEAQAPAFKPPTVTELARKLIAARDGGTSNRAQEYADRVVMTAALGGRIVTPETEDEIAALLFAALLMMDD